MGDWESESIIFITRIVLDWTGLARLARLLFGLESQSSRPSGTLSQSVRGTFSLTSPPPLAVVERQSSGGRGGCESVCV